MAEMGVSVVIPTKNRAVYVANTVSLLVDQTVKPLEILQYLATLLLPPPRETPRRLLVPFCGSGSEVLAALQAGWDEVVGVDMVDDYLDIARARVRHWDVSGRVELEAELFSQERVEREPEMVQERLF